MQCVSDLTKLRDAVNGRVRFLRQLVTPITTPLGSADRRSISFATIEIDNLVVVGLRQYTKSSLLRARSGSGARITASVAPASTGEAAAFVLRAHNPIKYAKMKSPSAISERDEVVMRDPKEAEKVLTSYSVSNLPSFSTALSLNADVFYEAKICRHFFAHRAENTFVAVKDFASKLGVLGVDCPEQLLVRGRPLTGVPFLVGWLADVENFFDLAT